MAILASNYYNRKKLPPVGLILVVTKRVLLVEATEPTCHMLVSLKLLDPFTSIVMFY